VRVASVLLAPRAVAELERLIRTLSLPYDSRERLRAALDPLGDFPRLGAPLHGRWEGYRFVLGPWRWMLLVYVFDEDADAVFVVTIQDSRSAGSVTSTG
jgi:ParE toxin of type II toxin-antitoxin system, parDE